MLQINIQPCHYQVVRWFSNKKQAEGEPISENCLHIKGGGVLPVCGSSYYLQIKRNMEESKFIYEILQKNGCRDAINRDTTSGPAKRRLTDVKRCKKKYGQVARPVRTFLK